MYIIQVTCINFKNRPDEQTVTYAKRIPEWMSQWTVRNNYAPLLCADLEEGLREQQANIVDQFWADMNSAVPELCKRDKASHMADFSFDYTIHSGAPGAKTVYHGSRNFEYFQLLPQRDDSPVLKTKAYYETRERVAALVRKHFKDGNLYDEFRNHKYSLKALCDEQGIYDVTRLMDDFAVDFGVGSMEILDMDLDNLTAYILEHA